MYRSAIFGAMESLRSPLTCSCTWQKYVIQTMQTALVAMIDIISQGFSSIDGGANIRKFKLVTPLSADRPYTAMAIVPPLLSRSGLLEVLIMNTYVFIAYNVLCPVRSCWVPRTTVFWWWMRTRLRINCCRTESMHPLLRWLSLQTAGFLPVIARMAC